MFLSAAIAFFLLLYVAVNIKPWYDYNGGGFGLGDFQKGIPISVTGNYDIPDSSVLTMQALKQSDSSEGYVPVKKINARFYMAHSRQWNAAESKMGSIHDIQLTSGKIFIEPANALYRLILCFPIILDFVLTAICLWQISQLLTEVLKNRSFSLSNYRRIRNVGALIIVLQLVLLVYQFAANPWFAWANYGSAINATSYSHMLEVRPDFGFSLSWLLVGIMLLIVSSPFKTGNELQQEQDLTV